MDLNPYGQDSNLSVHFSNKNSAQQKGFESPQERFASFCEKMKTKAKDSNPHKEDSTPYKGFSNRRERGRKGFESPI